MILFNKFKKRTKGNILQIVEKAHLFRRYILLVIGIVIYAVGYNLFLKKFCIFVIISLYIRYSETLPSPT